MKGSKTMKKNEILNQYYKDYADKFTSVRIVKFYDKDVDNDICIVKLPDYDDPYVFMDIKSGWIFGYRFKTLKEIRNFKNKLYFKDCLKRLEEVRQTARYQQLCDRYERLVKYYERTHKQ